MAQIFPKWADKIPLYVVVIVALGLVSVVGFFWYYGSPKYTDVGYRPKQPVAYSHKLHAGDLGMDCRYCHTAAEVSASASIPPTQTCMNCHTLVANQSEKLLIVRESWATGKSIEWIRIHNLPDYSYFDHSAHLNAGVGCETCHGNIAAMEVVGQVQPLSMGWCLDCHRNPGPFLRTKDQLTKMNWKPPLNQAEFAKQIVAEKQIKPPLDCSGCHR